MLSRNTVSFWNLKARRMVYCNLNAESPIRYGGALDGEQVLAYHESGGVPNIQKTSYCLRFREARV